MYLLFKNIFKFTYTITTGRFIKSHHDLHLYLIHIFNNSGLDTTPINKMNIYSKLITYMQATPTQQINIRFILREARFCLYSKMILSEQFKSEVIYFIYQMEECQRKYLYKEFSDTLLVMVKNNNFNREILKQLKAHIMSYLQKQQNAEVVLRYCTSFAYFGITSPQLKAILIKQLNNPKIDPNGAVTILRLAIKNKMFKKQQIDNLQQKIVFVIERLQQRIADALARTLLKMPYIQTNLWNSFLKNGMQQRIKILFIQVYNQFQQLRGPISKSIYLKIKKQYSLLKQFSTVSFQQQKVLGVFIKKIYPTVKQNYILRINNCMQFEVDFYVQQKKLIIQYLGLTHYLQNGQINVITQFKIKHLQRLGYKIIIITLFSLFKQSLAHSLLEALQNQT